MNIEFIESLAGEFRQLLSSGKPVVILDAANVEVITTPALQLIISLEKTMSASGGTFAVKNGGDAFISAFKDAGIENLLSRSN